jgi:O-antigen/teichoic acid export membrane protein
MVSIFPSVAHLHSEGDTRKFRSVIATILAVSYGGAIIGLGTYMAANQMFITLWIGPGQSLGEMTTLCMALGIMVLFMRQLLFLFLISIDDIKFASFMDLVEAVCRMAIMVGLLYGVGLIGLPLGMLFSCSLFGLILWHRFKKKVPPVQFQRSFLMRPLVLLALVFITGYAASLYFTMIASWGGFGVYLAVAVATLSTTTLIMIPQFKSECGVYLAPIVKRWEMTHFYK